VVAVPVGTGGVIEFGLLETAGRTANVVAVVVDNRTGETTWAEPLPPPPPPPPLQPP
jgi:hypothetical protein